MSDLTYEQLRDAIANGAVGVRTRVSLEPLGGPNDKVFPPTYANDRAGTKYAIETRRIDGESVQIALLDSVASSANRQELALLEAVRDGDLALPLVSVDFRGIDGAEMYDRISSLEASHRVFDAILRDSLLGEVLFRNSDVGQSVTEASPKNAAALFCHNPATLLFGGWDSTGPKGGLGAKYERCLVTEVVAIGVETGTKTASRIDPLGIETKAGPLYVAADQSLGEWTTDSAEAAKEKGKPKLVTGGGDGAAGRPSQVNHGNVTPSLDDRAGGVTADRIEATSVISFNAIRKLRFPLDAEGAAIDDRKAAEVAAHAAIASLGLAAVVLAAEAGYDLRSRCALRATEALEFELLGRPGDADQSFVLHRDQALNLVRAAGEAAAHAGLAWRTEEVLLRPTDRLVELIRRSRELAATTSDEEGEA